MIATSRYRHPGDVVRLLGSTALLLGSIAVGVIASSLVRGGWFADDALPQEATLAAVVAVAVLATRWLTVGWCRLIWAVVVVVGGLVVALALIRDTAQPLHLVFAFALGATVGTVLLVGFGAPDRRPGPAEIAAALQGGGFDVEETEPAAVVGKGSRPFVATNAQGERFFVKVLGQDQRDADLLYRVYRSVRLSGVGDVRPAASLKQAVEHQALVGMMAARVGVRVPAVHRVIEGSDAAAGSVMLVTDFINGTSLADLPDEDITDALLEDLWREVDSLHHAHIAHRSLRMANVMVDEDARPWIVDFSFSELDASARAIDVDVAELLASLASRVGPERAVDSAASVVTDASIASAVPLLQPLALSASTRRDVAGDKLLSRTREAAAAASGSAPTELASIQRVRGRTLLMIALAAGAFYFILPQLAQVDESFEAFKSAHWGWLPLLIVMSLLTYVASAIGLLGTVPLHVPFVPTLNVQFASSFVNRVSPANVGGMAANVRFLQKNGVGAAPAVAAVGLNSVAGGITHIVLLVFFFVWSGSELGKAFSLPSSSKILVIIAVVAALFGILFLTRWGRKTVFRPLAKGIRSAASNLARVAKSPVKLTMLFGGSAGVTLAYVGALTAAVNAFGGGISVAKVGAVYLAASALAAATPTPGNLGAIEAALVAGLTGVGMESGPAVSAVLTYRLATYWLPILPGWLAWWYLQRKKYL
jgi:glycosyltransferase 2 family protein